MLKEIEVPGTLAHNYHETGLLKKIKKIKKKTYMLIFFFKDNLLRI